MEIEWEEYVRTRSLDARNCIVEEYWPLVTSVAYKVSHLFKGAVQVEDLTAYGAIGLIEAVERFDPDRGTDFAGFASIRIRGAMIDELRVLDWVPRNVRTLAKQIGLLVEDLTHSLNRVPNYDEIAEAFGNDAREFESAMIELHGNGILSLNAPMNEDGGTFIELLADRALEEKVEDPFDERPEQLLNAMAHLRQREQIILQLIYFEGLSHEDIGELLGMKASGVSIVHTSALIDLRSLVMEGRS